MADIWSGNILLPDGNVIKEVGLTTQNLASAPTFSTTTLRFLTTVDTARIPLYLAVGPSLDVWTTEESTQAWFESLLLSKSVTLPNAPGQPAHEWWSLARSQSPIGILAQVQDVGEDAQKPRVTEILFYGTIATHAAGGLPTPPSSLSIIDNLPGEQLPELRVHATPISSDLLYHTSIDPPLDNDAHFLPPLHSAHAPPRSPKKHRDIFEEATIANKKARGRGGRAVSAAAARGSESQQPYTHRKSSLSIDKRASPFTDSRPQSASGALPHPSSRPHSRSPSISSDTRPLSRKGQPEAHGRRSNLSQVATIPTQPEEPTTESRNKDALVKVVMAAMRMHGLQQRKPNKSRRASLAVGGEESERLSDEAIAEAAKDEEYKLIYHQTYKGAALALRKHMSEKPLHVQPDRMRDVVEKLLTIFLSDPLAEPLPAEVPVNPVATPGGKSRPGIPGSTHSHASPFDLPSTSRPSMMRSVTDSHIYTGSPISKKRGTVNQPPPT